jgi:hypothetical protein
MACAIAGAVVLSPTVQSRFRSESPPAFVSGKAALDQARQAGIDIGAVIETVGHRVEPAKGREGTLVSEDRLYRAEFGDDGFALTLRGERSSRAGAIRFERSPAFRLRTTRVRRGDTAVALARGSWRGKRNSARRTLAPLLSERVTAREGRLEWGFVLDRAPAGTGALMIEADASARGAGAGATHSRFAVGAGRNVTVSHLVVRDAQSRELYRAQPAVAGRKLSLTVPGRVLRGAAYPLTIDPVVTPEYPASNPVVGAARGEQHEPALAFDGTNYLVAWRDHRSGISGIYGTRASPTGRVLDPSGIAISTQSGDIPAVAFDGTNYLVVWAVSPACPPCGNDDIYGARVSTAGSVLDATPIPITTTTSHESSPAVAFDGTNYLVVWEHGPVASISGTRVSQAGTVLDPGGIAISTGDVSSPALAFDGTNYLVVWTAGASNVDVYGARVSRSGNVLDPAGIPISTAASDQFDAAVAFDGTNYLVVWADGRANGSHVYGARVSPTGSVLDPAGIRISEGADGYPDLAFDGTNYLVVWWDVRTGGAAIYGARVSPAGAVLDPDGIEISPPALWDQDPPVVAFGGTDYLVVWTRHKGYVGDHGPRTDVQGVRVSPAGNSHSGSEFVVSTDVNDQEIPVIGFDGTNYLVVWEDYRSGWGDIYGTRVSPTGGVLDPGGIPIALATTEANFGWPALAFDGTNYLVAWTETHSANDSEIHGRRVTPAGVVLDPGGIAIAIWGENYFPALAFDGTNYLVTWTARGNNRDIYGARVSPAGSVLDPTPIPISTTEQAERRPALSFDGTNYLVVWEGWSGVRGARVSPAGVVVDPAGIPISAASGQNGPAVAFDGTNYLVAWEHGSDVHGARVSPAGIVLDPAGIPISTAANAQTDPALAFDGVNYLVVWADSRLGKGEVYGARVSSAGGVLDLEGVPISTAPGQELHPVVVGGPAGRVAVAYERSVPKYEGAKRVFLRFADAGAEKPRRSPHRARR